MTVARRHHLTVALIAALAGAGIGLEAARDGLLLAPTLGFWVGALGIVALVIVLLTAPPETDSAPLTSAETGWAEFRREMRRARRGVKALTILRIPVAGPGADDAALALRSEEIAAHLRLVDRTWIDDGSVYVLLPESPRAAADVLLSRIRAVAPALLPADVRTATFPDDGLTSGAIIAAVHGAALGEVPIPIRATMGDADEAVGEHVVGDTAAGS
jgi:4-amino-4-deoxy-L-arabinose transferase-like glycosyltransferase